MPSCVHHQDLKSSMSRTSPSSSSSSRDGSNTTRLKLDTEICTDKKYELVRQSRKGYFREPTQSPPESRTFRSSNIFHGIPNLLSMLASFGIEPDALSQEFRRRILSFTREKPMEAVTTGKNELKIVLVMHIPCWESSGHDAPLKQDVKNSLEFLIRLSTALREETLKKVSYDGHELGSDCLSCLKEFLTKEDVIPMRCGHGFHYCCILRWLAKKSSCPTCRRQF